MTLIEIASPPVNPGQEQFEPYVKYDVPVKQSVYNCDGDTYKIEYKHQNFWTLRWSIQQGFKKIVTEKLVYVFPSISTEYGDIIPDSTIMQVITEGMNIPDLNVPRKWTHA